MAVGSGVNPINLTFMTICSLTIAYIIMRLLQVGKRAAGLPPGPRTLPIIGNLHLMPKFKPYKQFTEWGERYGPIYSLMVGSSPLIVLQSQEIAKELLDKRGSSYSSRPDMYILSDLCSRGLRQVAMKYTPTWRQVHRINHKILNANATRAYTPYQTLESRQMLVDILNNPGDHEKHIQRYSNSVTCQMVYGFRTTTFSDPKLQSVVSIFFEVCELAVTVPARLMDCYPILQKIPKYLLPACRKAMNLDRVSMTLFLDRWLEGKKKAQDGTAMPCFCASLAQAQKAEDFSDELASYMAGDIVEAGSSTTSDELVGFLMAMVTHPDIQRRAQEELDSVVGTDRLPKIEDMVSLPYIRGCVKETLRWMPTSSLLIPHSPLRDDVYRDYIIPAGASVVVNVWALNKDPKRWPNPQVFNPLRFKDDIRSEHEIATSGDPATLRHNYIFGAGRRLCQGIHIAERSLFLAIASMLWAFDIETPDISKIDTEDLRGGLAMVPAPFECYMKPRDMQRANVIRQEWQQLQNEFLDPVTKQWIKVPDGLPLSTYVDN
ncbi:putative cytochrome P450 [Hypoxylon trugodes]|uniref:putative cytochrome P450 n=1 Tax=Hypoxylon trugodes TaxID=326681 RepID=UPI0021961FB7|nr:putative cytochrome P450 [Hypoxylon trugodes]KAI1384394.1 putative cytochrome P450 [Hypoxylon trugodes]